MSTLCLLRRTTVPNLSIRDIIFCANDDETRVTEVKILSGEEISLYTSISPIPLDEKSEKITILGYKNAKDGTKAHVPGVNIRPLLGMFGNIEGPM